ncbi:MAG: TolC family protein [Brumimicrobium sp.]
MRKLKIVLGFGLIVFVLQSCLVAKEYASPDNIVQTEEYRNSEDVDTNTIATLSWKEMFTDPILQNHIDHALTNNIDHLIALEQIKVAEAYVKQGKAGFYPTVNAAANYSLSRISENGIQGQMLQLGVSNQFHLFDLSLNVSWEADIWGKIRSQKRAFDASFMQTHAVKRVIQTQLISGIAKAYYQLLALDKEVEVLEKSLELRRTSFETTEAMQQSGIEGITSVAVQQTKAQYLEAQVMLININNQIRLIENAICILMGDEPHDIERSTLDEQVIDSTLKTGVPIQLLANRPDVQSAEYNYRMAFEMVNVARAQFYPTLTIGVGGGLQSRDINNWFSINSIVGNLVGGIVAPIFNQRKIRTNFEVSQIQQEQARLNYRGVLIQASKEVSDALYNYQAAEEKMEIQLEQEELLNQSVEDSQSLLASGLNNFSYLEVLNAQQSALNAGLSVIGSQVRKMTSIVDLYQALGGGVK